jgi:hypothetical protein
LASGPKADAAAIGQSTGVAFVLAGEVGTVDGRLRLVAALTDTATGATLWGETYLRDLAVPDIQAIEADLVTQLARLLRPGEALPAAEVAPKLPSEAAYHCRLTFYAYRADRKPARRDAARDCLEQTVDDDKEDARAWAMLAEVGIDAARLAPLPPVDQPEDASPGPFETALKAAQKALAFDAREPIAWRAMMALRFRLQEVQAGLAAGERALAIDPEDPLLMGAFGTRLALSGEWGQGLDLVRKALVRDPASQANRAILALDFYRRGELPAALAEMERIPPSASPEVELLRAAFLAEAGETEAAAETASRAEAAAPWFFADLDGRLARWNMDPALEARLSLSWRQAAGNAPAAAPPALTNAGRE